MAAELVFLLATVLIVGVATQWVAWRLNLPPILLMVAGGLIAGPATGWLRPDEVMGDLLRPVVALGVAVILFEGGMTLRFSELRGTGRVLSLLVSLGVLVTWAIGTLAAHLLLGLDLRVSFLLGAVVTVSGPTVVGPLLNHIRPQGVVASLLKWEGIVIDPVGALLAVFVFLAVSAAGPGEAALAVTLAVLTSVFIGIIVGLAAAGVLVLALRRYWIPDQLQNAVALAFVLTAFVLANAAQEEAGLVSVTLMGIAMANQRFAPVRRILEFKETLRVLIIPALFILLTARLTRADVAFLDLKHLFFLVLLVLVARPLAVALSTLGSPIRFRERVFLAGLMPRGIVAAAVASVLALDLEALGVPDAEALVPMTFLVIIGTVLVYGVGGGPLARLLDVSRQGTGGVLLIGAGPFARELGSALQEEEVEVHLIDTNRGNVTQASVESLHARNLDALSEYAEGTLEMERVDHVLSLTPNDQVNLLCTMRYVEYVGQAHIFRLATSGKGTRDAGWAGGRILFSPSATWLELNRRVHAGHYVARTKLTDRFTLSDWKRHHGPDALPLALIRSDHSVEVLATDARPEAGPGDTLLGLVPPEETEKGPEPTPDPTPIVREVDEAENATRPQEPPRVTPR